VVLAALCAVTAGAAGGTTGNDRSFKLDLIGRLQAPPQLVVLGSSRSKRAEPSYLRSLTGLSGFNAGVISGTAADAFVMTRYLGDCQPLRGRRYIWFVDADVATNGVNPDLTADPRGRKYLDPTSASARRPTDCERRTLGRNNRYNPDGSFGSRSQKLPERPHDLTAKVSKLLASVVPHPPQGVNPKRYVWFERALAYMNSHGSRPVIVFDPIYPSVLAKLRSIGFPAHVTSTTYLSQLHKRYDFVVVNAQDIRVWGGSPDDFSDPTHINEVNMRRLLRYVVSHSAGALR